jgi:hypothetical protein
VLFLSGKGSFKRFKLSRHFHHAMSALGIAMIAVL